MKDFIVEQAAVLKEALTEYGNRYREKKGIKREPVEADAS